MRPTRRELLAGAGAGLVTGLAGCAGRLTGDGAAFGAVEATLPASVQEDTGYTHRRTVPEVITREFGRFGVSRSVEVTNVLSEYDRAVELGFLGTRLQAAVFAVLSTPQVSVLGRSFNPVADMSAVEIAQLLQQRYGQISDVEADEQFRAPIDAEMADVTRFTATARLLEAGLELEVYLYVSEAVELGEDFVVALAVHPRAFGERRGTVESLLDGVEHG